MTAVGLWAWLVSAIPGILGGSPGTGPAALLAPTALLALVALAAAGVWCLAGACRQVAVPLVWAAPVGRPTGGHDRGLPRQGHPDAPGHTRSRAPGRASSLHR